MPTPVQFHVSASSASIGRGPSRRTAAAPSKGRASKVTDPASAGVKLTRHSPGPAAASVAEVTVREAGRGAVVSTTTLRLVLNCLSPERTRSVTA